MAAYFARIRESLSGSAKQTPTRRYGLYFLFAALAASVLIGAWLWLHRQPVIHILATISLTGPGSYYGAPVLDGVRLAIEEANASGEANFELGVMDDQSSSDRARKLGGEICESPAIVTLGPVLTTAALASGPVFEKCGLVSIPPTAHGDDVPKNATTFQIVFNGGEMGSALAAYLKHVLGGKRAAVLFREDGYGRPFADGFKKAAQQLGLDAALHGFSTEAERANAVDAVASDPERPAVALGMLNADAVPILVSLRRKGLDMPVLAPSALAGEDFVAQFSKEPEEATRKGFFTERVYAASPIMFDSARADTLAFADRFRQRYGREPSWPSVQGYDAARLAIYAALRASLKSYPSQNDTEKVAAQRIAIRDYLASLDSEARALQGVTGPLWFTAERRRRQAVRVGMFHDGLFDSAPIQLVPVTNPGEDELQSGEVFSALPGQFVRRQRVVYTGIFINEVPRVDLARSDFGVDYYLWMRFARDAGPNSYDPTDITFPGMAGSNFARLSPSEQHTAPDGISYRLWRVEGQVRNDFNLRRFPFDRQTLRLAFFNARASADRIVYVLDRGSVFRRGSFKSSAGDAGLTGSEMALSGDMLLHSPIASPNAFRQLTQWRPVDVRERRENLVTDSPLGDPRRAGADRVRELSGFVVDTLIDRRTSATAAKTLLPLLLMTVIMFASLCFPHGLVKEKVTVAITAALSGAVLLASVNSQLGNVGYTILVEYVFYVYFGLSLLCIVSVLLAERLRVAGQNLYAQRTERLTRSIFVSVVALVVLGAAMT